MMKKSVSRQKGNSLFPPESETPKLLMLSGIVPKDGLKQHGIQVLVNPPHVGQNLLDHPILSHVFRVQDGYGLDNRLLRAGPMNKAAVQQYERDNSGPLSSTLDRKSVV